MEVKKITYSCEDEQLGRLNLIFVSTTNRWRADYGSWNGHRRYSGLIIRDGKINRREMSLLLAAVSSDPNVQDDVGHWIRRLTLQHLMDKGKEVSDGDAANL